MATKKIVLRPRHNELANPAITPDYLMDMLRVLNIPVNYAYIDTYGTCVALADGLEIALQRFPEGKRGTLVAFITRDGFKDDAETGESGHSSLGYIPNRELKTAVRHIGLVPRNSQETVYH